jgi:release factor glutamine methyltransferase
MKPVFSTILEIQRRYYQQIDAIDLDFLIGYIIKKDREFILGHPEFKISKSQLGKINKLINRRIQNEPLAYILGEKEFYGLTFKVNNHTLIPRPETELMIDMALQNVISHQSSVINIIDVGTGSGNIIISLANNIDSVNCELKTVHYSAIDISTEALKIAKKNAKLNQVDKQIKFFSGNLLDPVFKSKIINRNSSLIILANLPYLSKNIYSSCAPNVKKYEPKSALYSPQEGLGHYAKLLKQIHLLSSIEKLKIILFLEISPEQKKLIPPLIKKYFPQAKIKFQKDLAQKWRIIKITLN